MNQMFIDFVRSTTLSTLTFSMFYFATFFHLIRLWLHFFFLQQCFWQTTHAHACRDAELDADLLVLLSWLSHQPIGSRCCFCASLCCYKSLRRWTMRLKESIDSVWRTLRRHRCEELLLLLQCSVLCCGSGAEGVWVKDRLKELCCCCCPRCCCSRRLSPPLCCCCCCCSHR